MSLVRRSACAVVITLIGCGVVCGAATLDVRPDGGGAFATIQAALDAAAPGDTVRLADGVFTGAGNRDLQFGGKPLTLRSESGNAATCVLDAQGSDAEPHRAIWLHDLPEPGARLEGLTFRGGYDPGAGAGVYVNGCRVAVGNCVFRDNEGAYWFGGAGLAVESGVADLQDCLFTGNNAHSAVIPIATGGGGLRGVDSAISLVRCDFSANRAGGTFDSGGRGGGMALTGCGLTATGCLFRDNLAAPGVMGPAAGGGLFIDGGTADLAACLFTGNAAPTFGYGGALAAAGAAVVTVTSCTLERNDGMGALYLQGGVAAVALSIIADNFASDWSGEQPGVPVVAPEGAVTLSACDVFGHAGGDWVAPIADQHYLRGNFSAEPCHCDAAGGDFQLCADSACAPANNPWGQAVTVGAFAVGCAACGCSPPVGVDDGRASGPAPIAVVLRGATPNPFNPSTTLRFDLPEAGPVRLAVYDLRGRLVRLLVDDVRSAGAQRAVWDGKDARGLDAASGSYSARLEAGGTVAVAGLRLVR
ncbi:MAG: right-handed parallel beta-helix repeat-containing protein [Candidatus Krumholzibacteriia bacterium]